MRGWLVATAGSGLRSPKFVTPVNVAATEVGGIYQRRAGGIELRHKRVNGNTGAAKISLESIQSGGIGGSGEPRHIGAAGGVNRNSITVVILAAAEVHSNLGFRNYSLCQR